VAVAYFTDGGAWARVVNISCKDRSPVGGNRVRWQPHSKAKVTKDGDGFAAACHLWRCSP
jgi:hypothetical protein